MSTDEKVKAEGGPAEHIVLRVRDQTGEEIQFKVRGWRRRENERATMSEGERRGGREGGREEGRGGRAMMGIEKGRGGRKRG